MLIPFIGFGIAIAACSSGSNTAAQGGMGEADCGDAGSSSSSGGSSGSGTSSGTGSSSGNVSSSGSGGSSGSGSSSGSSGSGDGGTDGGAVGADDFPRLGLISIGGPQAYASTFEPFAAKVHVVIIGGNWEGWQSGKSYDKETFISGVKAQS